MRKLRNTLYVLSEDAYLALDGETVEVRSGESVRNIPLHTLSSIVCFSYSGASPALMGKCVESDVAISFFDRRGRFLASVGREVSGNVLLRRRQYRIADDANQAFTIAKAFLTGKLYNSKYVLLRTARDHSLRVDAEGLRAAAGKLTEHMKDIAAAQDEETARGVEGKAAAEYFGRFDELILQNKENFRFERRSRRPPTDPVNALLSLTYSILAADCSAALQSVGLDPYVGFFHSDRPGRNSLALDLMEELRAPVADRFVLRLINDRIIDPGDFKTSESGAVRLDDGGRKKFFTSWQERKRDEIVHPFLEEMIPWGLVPFAQAQLLAGFIRGDIDGYPPFFWK